MAGKRIHEEKEKEKERQQKVLWKLARRLEGFQLHKIQRNKKEPKDARDEK